MGLAGMAKVQLNRFETKARSISDYDHLLNELVDLQPELNQKKI